MDILRLKGRDFGELTAVLVTNPARRPTAKAPSARLAAAGVKQRGSQADQTLYGRRGLRVRSTLLNVQVLPMVGHLKNVSPNLAQKPHRITTV
jgi:hypothetical protein